MNNPTNGSKFSEAEMMSALRTPGADRNMIILKFMRKTSEAASALANATEKTNELKEALDKWLTGLACLEEVLDELENKTTR